MPISSVVSPGDTALATQYNNLRSDILERTPTIVVDAAGNGDYTALSAAVTASSANDVIFIKSGTYASVGSITLKDGLKIIGENKNDTILQGGKLTITSTSRTATGTITLTKNSTTVAGSGTQFDADGIVPGDLIYIVSLGLVVEVDSVTNDTSLEIVEQFEGQTQSGLSFQAFAPVQNVLVENVTFESDSINGLNIFSSNNITVRDCIFTGSEVNILLGGLAANTLIENNLFMSGSQGVNSQNTPFNSRIINNVFYNINGNAISLVSHKFSKASGNEIHSVSTGVNLVSADSCEVSNNLISNTNIASITTLTSGGASKNRITGNIIRDSLTDGIYLDNNSDNNIITGNTVDGCTGIGIYIQDSTCDKNVVGNNISLNNGTNYTDNGTATSSSNNITA